jgi:mRNA deadenylase 3'-5' endonuclease subunit Ccr4
MKNLESDKKGVKGDFLKKKGLTTDGCGTLYKENIFSYQKTFHLELNDAFKEFKDKYNGNTNTGHCTIITHLTSKIKKTTHHFLIANIHLYWNPNHDFIKFA